VKKLGFIALTLLALVTRTGYAQTPIAPRDLGGPMRFADASGSANASGSVANASGSLAVEAVPYVWPSPTTANPYPIISLPRSAAPPAYIDHEDNNGTLLKGDPLLDWTGCGWFAALEADVVGPAVKNRLTAPVTVAGVTTLVQLPSADLRWTGMPHLELGYQLGQGAGALSIVYRGLYASGTGTIGAFDAAGATAPLSSHLTMSVIDFDYSSRENSVGPLWDMKWRIGARVATLFFDSTAATALLGERESNNFVGGGLHAGVELKRRLWNSGFSLLGSLDGGAVLGSVHQLYSESIAGAGTGSTRSAANEPAPVLEVRLGAEYAPRKLPNLHFSTGYLFERWWSVGETLGTQGEVTYQGVFFRGQWRF
jgi:hypothetical protein